MHLFQAFQVKNTFIETNIYGGDMKSLQLSVLGLSLCVTNLSASAFTRGPISSGGGMAVACADSVKLLDYHEAEVIYKEKNVAKATGNLFEDYSRLTYNAYHLQGHFVPDYQKLSQRNLNYFFENVEWVEKGSLPFLNDQGQTADIPSDCSLEQLAIWYDTDGTIKIDQDLWNRMDTINQAALIKHEVWYAHERKLQELNSESTRRYVQQMLTPQVQIPAPLGTEDAEYFCTSNKTDRSTGTVEFAFHVAPRREGSKFVFSTFAAKPTLVGTTVRLPFAFSANRELIRSASGDMQFTSFPTDVLTDTRGQYQVHSAHFEGFSLQVEYKGTRPITIRALRDGVPFGKTHTISCSTDFYR